MQTVNIPKQTLTPGINAYTALLSASKVGHPAPSVWPVPQCTDTFSDSFTIDHPGCFSNFRVQSNSNITHVNIHVDNHLVYNQPFDKFSNINLSQLRFNVTDKITFTIYCDNLLMKGVHQVTYQQNMYINNNQPEEQRSLQYKPLVAVTELTFAPDGSARQIDGRWVREFVTDSPCNVFFNKNALYCICKESFCVDENFIDCIEDFTINFESPMNVWQKMW